MDFLVRVVEDSPGEEEFLHFQEFRHEDEEGRTIRIEVRGDHNKVLACILIGETGELMISNPWLEVDDLDPINEATLNRIYGQGFQED